MVAHIFRYGLYIPDHLPSSAIFGAEHLTVFATWVNAAVKLRSVLACLVPDREHGHFVVVPVVDPLGPTVFVHGPASIRQEPFEVWAFVTNITDVGVVFVALATVIAAATVVWVRAVAAAAAVAAAGTAATGVRLAGTVLARLVARTAQLICAEIRADAVVPAFPADHHRPGARPPWVGCWCWGPHVLACCWVAGAPCVLASAPCLTAASEALLAIRDAILLAGRTYH